MVENNLHFPTNCTNDIVIIIIYYTILRLIMPQIVEINEKKIVFPPLFSNYILKRKQKLKITLKNIIK